MSTTRRGFLKHSPLLLSPILPAQCSSWFEQLEEQHSKGEAFLHGVASGDPDTDRVILWTRVTPDGDGPRHVLVRWEVYSDVGLRHIARRGVTYTDAEVDYTVKVDADGLEPGRTYCYRFSAFGQRSPVGRTRTLPKRKVKHLRFAVASCSNYPYGYFNGYRLIAQRADLDAVLHLGDYIYEYGEGEYGDGAALGRIPVPATETFSLSDYRQRHAQYKSDPDLQEAHRQHPFIVVWDDHESANDAWTDGAENHQPGEGDWQARKAAALQAYFEWMPIRPAQRDDQGRVYRGFEFGELVNLAMLDTRLAGREPPASTGCDPVILDPDRQLLGEEQERWFLRRLARSKARWNFVGQQVMFGQLANLDQVGCVLNPDQWDGYAAARARVCAAIRESDLDNVVILTGDIHTSWANDIHENPFDPSSYDPATGAGSLAVEFVTPGITSPGIEDVAQARFLEQVIGATHPHVRFVELNQRGYLLLDVTPARVQAEWYHLETITEISDNEALGGIYATLHGTNHVVEVPEPSLPMSNAPELAPGAPSGAHA